MKHDVEDAAFVDDEGMHLENERCGGDRWAYARDGLLNGERIHLGEES